MAWRRGLALVQGMRPWEECRPMGMEGTRSGVVARQEGKAAEEEEIY